MDEKSRVIHLLGKQFTLSGTEGDSYFESIDDNGSTDQALINLLTAAIDNSTWVVDVGANIGYMTLAASALSKKGKIFAFEPAKDTYKLLRKNVASNGLRNVKTFSMGLSNVKGKTTLSYSTTNSSGAFVNKGVMGKNAGHGSETIELVRLDSVYDKLGITQCGFIKIDVEGHEPDFLAGAQKFIKKFKPLAVIEANHWCLNAFNRTSLPDFIDQVYLNFPVVFAYQDSGYLDLSDPNSRYRFYHENIVDNNYQNIFCGFDTNDMLTRLHLTAGSRDLISRLKQDVANLEQRAAQLQQELDIRRHSRARRLASRVYSKVWS